MFTPLQLTDQEAAADEAIERLCLRCHNLETRLLEKRTPPALPVTNNSPDEHSRTSNGRLSPVVEAGNDSEEEDDDDNDSEAMRRMGAKEEEEASEFKFSELQSKYFSLNTLYEAALKRYHWLLEPVVVFLFK